MGDTTSVNTGEPTLHDFRTRFLSGPRRPLLRILASYEKPQAASDVATELALRERDTTVETIPWEEIKRIHVRLHHNHLPKLADAGLVTYDDERRMAGLTSRGERLSVGFEWSNNE